MHKLMKVFSISYFMFKGLQVSFTVQGKFLQEIFMYFDIHATLCRPTGIFRRY